VKEAEIPAHGCLLQHLWSSAQKGLMLISIIDRLGVAGPVWTSLAL